MTICKNCNRGKCTESQNICTKCHIAFCEALTAIPLLAKEAGECLLPGNGGRGSSSGERTIGINVTALDYNMGSDILAVLWSWESMIRSERQLTPPALIPALPSAIEEIMATCTFHITHAEWSESQDWFSDLFNEVAELKAKGLIAARQTPERTSRLYCPAEREDGLPCGRSLRINPDDFATLIYCSGCKTEWTAIRLIAVKMADRSQKWWIDLEAASMYLSISERQLRRVVKTHNVARKGQLYDFHGLLDAKSA